MENQEQPIFKCEKCSYASIRKSLLIRHQEVHDEKRKFYCFYCDLSYRYKRSLVRHLRDYHQNFDQANPDQPQPSEEITSVEPRKFRKKNQNLILLNITIDHDMLNKQQEEIDWISRDKHTSKEL
jgi:uncharacterized Zn-finger protein